MLVTDALKSDHRCIGRMLTIVQKAGNCLDFGQQVSPQVFHDACDFFDHFVDAYHCNQEENALFPALATLKLPPDGCSLRAFRADHAQARLIAGTISSLSTRFAAGDTRVKHPLVLAVRSYVNLLWSHILREDHLLFVAADDLLPATEQQALSACARIEGTLMNAAAHTHYDALLITMESAAAAWVLPGIGQSQLEPDVPRWRRAVLSVRGRSTDAQGVDRLVSA